MATSGNLSMIKAETSKLLKNLQGYLNKKNSDQSEEQKGPQAMEIIDSIGANVM